jgi:3-hydroxybutyryl-CoA dehydrogenase
VNEPKTLAVIGSGTMGRGIAQVAAEAGYDVRLCDVAQPALDRAIGEIAKMRAKGVEKGKLSKEVAEAAAARTRTTTSLEDAALGAGWVIEAVPENPEIKKELFRAVAIHLAPGAILASNTSSLPIHLLAEAVPDPSRFIGLHFFNPVPIMKLIEVVRGSGTSDSTTEAAVALSKELGKTPIVVRDSPGFATSRLGVLLGLEAMRMVEEGVASAADIDTAMELGYNHPMGPLRLTDLVGLDVRLGIAETLERELGSVAFRPPQLLRRMVAEGKLGKKTGEGFYRWES